jgi:ribosomal-protein-alanine N-acetyltransferase
LVAIEQASFESPWRQRDFVEWLTRGDADGVLLQWCGDVVGYAMYEWQRTYIRLGSMAILQEYRRRGAGRCLVNHLIRLLLPPRLRRITLEVSERNLDGQLFFRALGFKAVNVLRQWCDDGQDAYVMTYRLPNRGVMTCDSVAVDELMHRNRRLLR